MLKLVAGITLALTIVETVTTVILFPPAAPIVAAAGTAVAMIAGQEVVKIVCSRVVGYFVPECVNPEIEEDEDESSHHDAYTYSVTETTKVLEKSDSGNHIVEKVTEEQRDGEHTDRKSRKGRPHP